MTFDLSWSTMVRGGPANRAVKRAKIFALTKVGSILSNYHLTQVMHNGE